MIPGKEGVDLLQSDALRSFAVFAKHRNFTRAAEELFISQPALHVKVAKLTTALGAPLYERSGRKLVLTPAGEHLAQLAHDVRARSRTFIDSHETPLRGPLVLAAGRGAHLWVIGNRLVNRTTKARTVRYEIADRRGCIERVELGEADIGVFANEPPPRSLGSRVIASFSQSLIVPAAHPLARKTSVRLADLAGSALVVPPTGRAHRESLTAALTLRDVAWTVGVEADGWDLQMHFVSLGLGVAVANGCVPPLSGLRSVPVRDLPQVLYWAVWRPSRAADVRSVVDLLDRNRR